MDKHILSEKQIREAIDSSGYVLELSLCPFLEKHGFFADSSAQFKDQDSGKSREIDIFGWKNIFFDERDHPHTNKLVCVDVLKVDLVIECKSNKNPVIFFTRQPHEGAIGSTIFSGTPPGIIEKDSVFEEITLPLYQELRFEDFHQNWKVEYPAYKFARIQSKTKYDREKKEDNIEWSLTHNDLWPAVEKVCKAADWVRSKNLIDSEPEDISTEEISLFTIYPVMVFSGPIFECRILKDLYEIHKTDFLLLEWTIRSDNLNQNFFVSITTESYFDTFLSKVDADISNILKQIKENKDRLKDSIVKISKPKTNSVDLKSRPAD